MVALTEIGPIQSLERSYRDSIWAYDSLDYKVLKQQFNIGEIRSIFETAYIVLNDTGLEVKEDSVVDLFLRLRRIPTRLAIYDVTPGGENKNVHGNMALLSFLSEIGSLSKEVADNWEWDVPTGITEGHYLTQLLMHDGSSIIETRVWERNGMILPETVMEYSRRSSLIGINIAIGLSSRDLTKSSEPTEIPMRYLDVILSRDAYIRSFPFRKIQ